MLSARQRALLEKAGCDIAFDNLTRQLYATDASHYQVEPAAVAFPRGPRQAAAVITAAAEAEISLTPRGAGSGLVGGAIGDGLVLEFARFNRDITALDLEKQTVRAGAGVVLDQLNAFLRPHGFGFGPDVATSSRATLGGMIANNSSGAHVPVYGCTADHVRSLEVAHGRRADRNPGPGTAPRNWPDWSRAAADQIAQRMPPGLLKRWPGYGMDRYLREPNASHLLAGSEGTLAAILSAELKIVPLAAAQKSGPDLLRLRRRGDAATVELLDLQPAAIEHLDRVLLRPDTRPVAFPGRARFARTGRQAVRIHPAGRVL